MSTGLGLLSHIYKRGSERNRKVCVGQWGLSLVEFIAGRSRSEPVHDRRHFSLLQGVSRLGRLHRGVLEGEQSKRAKSSTVQVQTSLDPPVLKQSATQSPGSERRHFFSFLFSNFNFVKKKSWGHLGGSVLTKPCFQLHF